MDCPASSRMTPAVRPGSGPVRTSTPGPYHARAPRRSSSSRVSTAPSRPGQRRRRACGRGRGRTPRPPRPPRSSKPRPRTRRVRVPAALEAERAAPSRMRRAARIGDHWRRSSVAAQVPRHDRGDGLHRLDRQQAHTGAAEAEQLNGLEQPVVGCRQLSSTSQDMYQAQRGSLSLGRGVFAEALITARCRLPQSTASSPRDTILSRRPADLRPRSLVPLGCLGWFLRNRDARWRDLPGCLENSSRFCRGIRGTRYWARRGCFARLLRSLLPAFFPALAAILSAASLLASRAAPESVSEEEIEWLRANLPRSYRIVRPHEAIGSVPRWLRHARRLGTP